jgi:hypothetical protein
MSLSLPGRLGPDSEAGPPRAAAAAQRLRLAGATVPGHSDGLAGGDSGAFKFPGRPGGA